GPQAISDPLYQPSSSSLWSRSASHPRHGRICRPCRTKADQPSHQPRSPLPPTSRSKLKKQLTCASVEPPGFSMSIAILLPLHCCGSVRSAQSLQNLRRCFFHGENLMASTAVLCNRFFVVCSVAVIVTTETAGIVRVSDVVWIRAPRHLQVRKYIPPIDP